MKETDFARYLTQFLSVYLPGQVGSKRNTQLAYRDSFSLLLKYCRDQKSLSPEKLTIAQVDKELVIRFLQWLEEEREGCYQKPASCGYPFLFQFFNGGRTTVYPAVPEGFVYSYEKGR